jgi:hypothetical protein
MARVSRPGFWQAEKGLAGSLFGVLLFVHLLMLRLFQDGSRRASELLFVEMRSTP